MMDLAAEKATSRRRSAPARGSAPAAASGEPVTVVGRQAIHDLRGRVVAHELLFRTVGADTADFADADAATAEVLVSAFTDIGLDELVGDRKAFINVPHRFLVDGLCHILPQERVVLEILEDVPVTGEVIAAVTDLVDAGYTVALDDFEYRPEFAPLIDLAHIIKVDLLALTPHELDATIDRLGAAGRSSQRRVRLLAEKVEDQNQIPALAAAGFELFQGYGLTRPQNIESGRRSVMLQVLADLHRPDLEIVAAVDTISTDPALTYALLRIVNSAAVSRGTRISSIRHAVVMLGIDALRNWATLLLMTRVTGGSAQAVVPALVRAKVCERLADAWGISGAVGFTLGMLSSLPDILAEPLPPIVARLSLDAEIEQALLEQTGPFGRVLECAMAYERGDLDALARLDAPPWLADATLAGVAWAQQVTTFTAESP